MDAALLEPAAISGLVAAFLMGLLGSGHCAGMCGGVACALTLRLPTEVRSRLSRLAPRLLGYSAGRIASYAFAGALAGGLGAGAARLLPMGAAHVVGFATSGVLLVLIGVHVAGWWRPLDALERAGGQAWRRLDAVVRERAPDRRRLPAVALGALWGWIPCGLVYGALLLALSSGSAAEGALRMLAFGLGTVPMVVAIGAAGGWLAALGRDPALRRWAGASLIGLGVLTVAGASLVTSLHDPALAGLEGLCTADGVGAPLAR